MRSSLSMLAPPRRSSLSGPPEDDYNDANDDAVDLSAVHETSVVRYFTTRLMLRHAVNSDDGDNANSAANLLSIYEPKGAPNSATPSSLLGKTPALVVVPPVLQKSSHSEVTTAVFTVIPAEGFEKEPGQPVCYNDPIELVDQFGRILGIASRSPHVGHLAADGHGEALVIVFKRRAREEVSCPSRLLKQCKTKLSTASKDNPQYQMHKKLGLRRSSRTSVVEMCGGDRICIPGLIFVRKKAFPGGCVMQHKFFSDASTQSSDGSQPDFLKCEIVVTSGNDQLPIDVNPLLGGTDFVAMRSRLHMADRTATGEFVGVLHFGILHRRSDHTRIWKKRFFVLTQVALHRFEPNVTIESSRNAKSRGDLLIKDCRRVRYEKFARPHELDIELNNGKTLSMHSEDAVSCAKWASILSYAIESPQWIHTEHSFTTFWRSSDRYESPNCPKVDKIEVLSSGNTIFSFSPHLVADQPQWGEKLSLGELQADGFATVHLSNGAEFKLSLEDISSALLSPSSSTLHTSAQIDSMTDRESSVAELDYDGPSQGSTFSASQRQPRFLVRLRYRAELQLDRRIDIQLKKGILSMKLEFAAALLACGFVPLYIVGPRCQDSAAFLHQGIWHLHVFAGYHRHFGVLCLEILALIVFAPVLWQCFATWYRKRLKEAKLQWFLTLLSVEVQPETGQEQREDFEEDRRSSIAMPPDWDPENRLSDKKRQDEVYRFRLENALETILGRPQFPYFAVKKFFPNRFLGRDEQGRRVLLVSVNAANWKSLARHNLSPFAVERYFLYLWEFIWSYNDFINGVAHSELVMILDCTGWAYWSIFGRSIRVMHNVLIKTHQYYPGRLAKVVVAGNTLGFQHYAQLFCASLPLDLCAKCIVTSSLGNDNLKEVQSDSKTAALGKLCEVNAVDEQAFVEFALSLLSTYATVTIPGFTRREVDQATRFTKSGSLQSADDAPPLNRSGSSATRAKVGTKALLIPATEIEWSKIYQNESCAVFISPASVLKRVDANVGGDSPTRIAQMRGVLKMKSTDIDSMVLFLQDPSQWKLWNAAKEEMILLDTLSSNEDVCFWSRQIPFINFSSDGNRIEEVKTVEAYFNCVVRRIYQERKQPSSGSSYTILWKTTSAQQNIINDRAQLDNSFADSTGASTPQWKKFEDPVVTVCYVLEPRFNSNNTIEGIDFSFWYQLLLPSSGHLNKAIEVRIRHVLCISKLLAAR